MKTITLFEMEVASLTVMIIWLFVISSSQSYGIGDNFFPHVTTATDTDSDFDGKCLSCKNKNQLATEIFSSQEIPYMEYEDETADKTTTEPLMETSIDVTSEILYNTRNPNKSLHQYNPNRESELYDASTDDSTSTNVQFENSNPLFGSSKDSKEELLTNTDSTQANHREKKSSTSVDGMWFGPRLGRRNKRLNNSGEITKTGIWFGRRLGQRNKKSDNDMWFEPRLGKRDRPGIDAEAVSAGMWFGPRLGRRDRRSGNGEEAISAGMWFGPRLGKRDQSANGEEAVSAGMWFGPRLGKRDKSGKDDAVSAGMWFGPRLGKRDRPGKDEAVSDGMWFGPRLGKRDQSANGEEAVSGGMWFGPRLGKRDRSANGEEAISAGMWFGPRLGKRDQSANGEAAVTGMWFGPRLGRRDRRSENGEHVRTGMWFGPRLGKRDRSGNSEAVSAGMWFGPRLGRRERRNGGGSSNEGMWFGPRLGRRDRRSTDNLKSADKWFDHKTVRDRHSEKHERSANTNMQFGYGLEKRNSITESNKHATNEGMWFGQRLGRRDKRSYSEEHSQEVWSDPQLERNENKSNQQADEEMWLGPTPGHVTRKSHINEIPSTEEADKIGYKVKKLFSNTASMFWTLLSGKNNSQSSYNFTPRLGRNSLSDIFNYPRMVNRKIQGKKTLFIPQHDHVKNKTLQRNGNVPNSVFISNLFSGGHNGDNDYIFMPRLSRELYENKQFPFAQNIRSAPKKSKVFRKYGYFTPRLGRYIDTY